MMWVLLIVIVVALAGVLWWTSRRASEAESETAYLPNGGPKPTIGTAVWRRVRRQ